jgi:RNA polymerase sigma-70 factor (ECF subfamily)
MSNNKQNVGLLMRVDTYNKEPAKHLPKSSEMMKVDKNKELQFCMIKVADSRCKQSFAVVFKHFASKVKSLANRQLNNESLATEIMQETMSQVWRKAHLYHPEKGAVSTWIYTIARNQCFDLLRKSQTTSEVNLADDIWPLVEQTVEESEVFSDHLSSKRLLNCINALPDKQQQVVRGVFFQELSQEQLARQLQIPLGTVKSRLRLAIEKLKKELGEQDD